DFWAHLGYADEDMENVCNPEEFLSYVHGDDQQRFADDIDLLIKEQQAKIFTIRVRGKNESYVWTEARLDIVRDARGKTRYISGVIADVSELKEIEQALRASEARHARIIQASNDGIWEWCAEDGGIPMKRT